MLCQTKRMDQHCHKCTKLNHFCECSTSKMRQSMVSIEEKKKNICSIKMHWGAAVEIVRGKNSSWIRAKNALSAEKSKRKHFVFLFFSFFKLDSSIGEASFLWLVACYCGKYEKKKKNINILLQNEWMRKKIESHFYR